MLRTLSAFFVSALLVSGCVRSDAPPETAGPDLGDDVDERIVRTGAQRLAEADFDSLSGLRLGLIVNHTARIDTLHLADALARAEGVEVAAIFGPEHGFRGTAGAGEKVGDGRDAETGAPIYSLYGSTRKPTAQMLEGLDALVFDIQDVGARPYTYISTMGLAMQAAAEAEIPFIVLDRPNPLGGIQVDGFLLEDQWASFVGMYPIPLQHGMTIGELARMIRGEAFLEGVAGLDLRVIEMEGWIRNMRWPETGLEWILPSPNLPHFQNALLYPGLVLLEATRASEGRGTPHPFLQFGLPGLDATALADTLRSRSIPGVTFHPLEVTPESISGVAPSPKHEGEAIPAVRVEIEDASAVRPLAVGVHVLHALYHAPDLGEVIDRPAALARLAGTERLRELLEAGADPETIMAAWEQETEAFRAVRADYLLY